MQKECKTSNHNDRVIESKTELNKGKRNTDQC